MCLSPSLLLNLPHADIYYLTPYPRISHGRVALNNRNHVGTCNFEIISAKFMCTVLHYHSGLTSVSESMSANGAEEDLFKIRVAKAKDLPPSWYDLVLHPKKFEQHLNKLMKNPYGMPVIEVIHSLAPQPVINNILFKIVNFHLSVFVAVEPTAMQLITTFLEKAGCIDGGQVKLFYC